MSLTKKPKPNAAPSTAGWRQSKQSRPGAAQLKAAMPVTPKRPGAPPSAQAKHPVPPPVYRPQQLPKVLQKKAAVAAPPPALSLRKTAAAPPVYRPQSAPRCLQPKAATPPPSQGRASLQKKSAPQAPPAYRPQPTPKCLQPKAASGAQPRPGQPPHRPLAASRPGAVVQPKAAPNAPPRNPSRANVIQRVSVEEWTAVRDKKVHGLTVAYLLGKIPYRKALMERYNRQYVSNDLQWNPAQRNSLFEKLIDEIPTQQLLADLQDIHKPPPSKLIKIEGKKRTIELCYHWIYPGSDLGTGIPTPMGQKTASSNLRADDVLSGDTAVINDYLRRIKQASDKPYAVALKIKIGQERVLFVKVPAEARALLEALTDALSKTENMSEIEGSIRVTPQRPSSAEIAESLLSAEMAHRHEPSYRPTEEELGHLDRIHETPHPSPQDDQIINILYAQDALARAIADDLGGDPVTYEDLLEVNMLVQTSGANKELQEDTHLKAGKPREADVSLPGVKLPEWKQVPTMLGLFLAEYNSFVKSVDDNQPKTAEAIHQVYCEAVRLHQEFIRIHPFSNGNGRVARALLYNILLAASLSLYHINADSNTFKGMSGMNLTGQVSTERMAEYLMAHHLNHLNSF